MRRVLVTGGSGFVGRHALAPLRARGFEVHAAARRPPAFEPGVTWHSADLLDPAQSRALLAAAQPTHLLHLAWTLPPGTYLEAPENVPWVGASLGLLDAFARQGGQRVVAVGTGAEYTPAAELCVEDATPLAPTTLYGACKDAVRRVAEAQARLAGVSFAWARLFFLHGPHEPPARLVPSVCRALVRGEPALLGPGTAVRDQLHVEDAGDALAALVEGGLEGAVNVASGEGIAVGDVAQRLGRLAGRPDLVRLGARPGSPGDLPRRVADASRLRDGLGWKPSRTLDEGLAATLAWWRAELQRSR